MIDLATRVCPTGPPCKLLVDNIFVRGDGKHYTAGGSLWVARWLTPQLGVEALARPNDAVPAVRVVGLADGAVLKGKHGLDAVTSFNVGVSRVEYKITGTTQPSPTIGVAVHTRLGWLWLWDTKRVPNGTYVVRALAYNAAGQSSTSKGVSVRVANEPG